MPRQCQTKIVATLGPASSTEERIGELVDAGADVFRLNFSHGTYDEHRERFRIIRRIEKRKGHPLGILLDLQGPKLRLGRFKGGRARLEEGETFRLDLSEKPGTSERASLPHPEIFAALTPGTALLVDDGKIRLEVLRCGADFAETEVITAGPLSDHKGVNVPSAMLDLSPITDKDRADLRFGLDLGVDWVALSFVQRPADVAEARRLIAGRAALMVKLEKPQAIEFLDEIIDLADAAMVARGDLGVEVPPEDVPVLQKRIVQACRHMGRPVVVATQMLDSMVRAPTPTRAEAQDVATAVYDGADAVMLSAESAVGANPVRSVAMMNRIIARVEADPYYRRIVEAERRPPEATSSDAISAAARQVAHTLDARAIVTFTSTGSTALRAARERPNVPILGLTPSVETARRLTLAWGVHPVLSNPHQSFEEMVSEAMWTAVQEGVASRGERVVVTAGVPFGTPGATNVLRIARVT